MMPSPIRATVTNGGFAFIRAPDSTCRRSTTSHPGRSSPDCCCVQRLTAVHGRAVRSVPMASRDPLVEFRADWLPHVTDAGLARLIDLLDKASPLLIHGAFTRAVPMGCIASHVAWNHPATCRLQHEAGAVWLTRIAGLNPATSSVVVAWDRDGHSNLELRLQLLTACRDEQARRAREPAEHLEHAAC